MPSLSVRVTSRVHDIQQEILRRMRGGAGFRTAHKEGGTTIRFVDGVWMREDYGDWSTTQRFTDDAQFLAFLAQFFRAELSRQLDPARPADEQLWSRIRDRLEYRVVPGAGGGTSPGVIVWGLVVATSMSIVFAKLRIANRGRAPLPSLDAMFYPSLALLALSVVVAGLWLRKHWK